MKLPIKYVVMGLVLVASSAMVNGWVNRLDLWCSHYYEWHKTIYRGVVTWNYLIRSESALWVPERATYMRKWKFADGSFLVNYTPFPEKYWANASWEWTSTSGDVYTTIYDGSWMAANNTDIPAFYPAASIMCGFSGWVSIYDQSGGVKGAFEVDDPANYLPAGSNYQLTPIYPVPCTSQYVGLTNPMVY